MTTDWGHVTVGVAVVVGGGNLDIGIGSVYQIPLDPKDHHPWVK